MRPLSWFRRYQIREFLTDTIWVLPVLAVGVALILGRVFVRIDETLELKSDLDAEAVRTSAMSLASALLTFIVFVCSSLLVAVQLASAQLTPRIISFVYKDLGTRFALAVFAFSFTFQLVLAVRIGERAPRLSVLIASLSTIFSLIMFFYLIDHLGRSLRPVGALRKVGRIGQKVMDDVYPRRLREVGREAEIERDSAMANAEVDRLVDRSAAIEITGPKEGTLLAFDLKGLVALAIRHECVIELVPQAGQFISRDETLFRVYGARTPPAANELRQMVAIGMERTYEQDPSYAFRIIVDVASKALSPAINDPTTAVLAIDQLHRLLRRVGTRRLDEGMIRDAEGRLRFVYWTRDWKDFVHLSVTEIRQFGGGSIQVMRRLRAMLDDLIHALPQERRPLLERELATLRRSLDRLFPDQEDRALAEEGDLQGVGGGSGRQTRANSVETPPVDRAR